MGILNVTPDSFSDGGRHFSPEQALDQADRMIEEHVDIIDIGGESTRPYAEPVTVGKELSRVIPVIAGIRQKHSISISIDTTKAEVARRALDAGADIINDVSALRHDPQMVDLVCHTSVPVIIMHMQGTPGDMQNSPNYSDVVKTVVDFFTQRLRDLEEKGIDRQRIIIDPGIGFGKTLEHNLSLIKHLAKLRSLGNPVLLGHSRKRFIGDITGLDTNQRDLPTAVISALAVSQKVDILRVHDVAANRHAVAMAQAIRAAC